MNDKEAITVDEAVSIIKRDYYQDVRDIVEALRQAVKNGEVKDRDAVHEWLHETIDGCQRVIYTWQAKLGLLSSDNEDAFAEEYGEAPKDVSQQMYAAMMRDILDMVDIDELFTECSDCGLEYPPNKMAVEFGEEPRCTDCVELAKED